jgi:hypothetical protein
MRIRKPLKLIVRCRGCATPYTIESKELATFTGWCDRCTEKLCGLRKATRIEWKPRRITARPKKSAVMN